MANGVSLRMIVENNKVICPNFLDWYKQVKIVLKAEKIAYVLDSPVATVPVVDASKYDKAQYKKFKANNEIAYSIMLTVMSSKL